MTDPVKQILIDMPYDDYRTDDVYELITDKIRQQVGRELLERSVWLGYTKYVREDTLREICKLEASDE